MYKKILNILAILCPLAVVYHGALHQNKQNKEIRAFWKKVYIGFSLNSVALIAIWIS